MMKKRMKALLAIGLSAIIMVCSAGCGNGKEHMKAETDPDTPVEDVSFPLKEKAELSFITSAPATSTQEPNERTILSIIHIYVKIMSSLSDENVAEIDAMAEELCK